MVLLSFTKLINKMKNLTYLITAFSFVFLVASCGESSREEAHEEVVQEERTDGDAVVGLNTGQQEVRQIQVVAENMAYSPNEIRMQPGQSLIVELVNRGDTEHSIEFELPDGEQELVNNVKPGESSTLQFNVPQKTGTYTFYCPVDNHKEKGMTGKLIVE